MLASKLNFYDQSSTRNGKLNNRFSEYTKQPTLFRCVLACCLKEGAWLFMLCGIKS